MKKLFVIACAFAAAIGCQKAEMEMPQENEGVKVPLKITASIAQTKTTMTNDGGVLKSAWKNGDKIYVQRFWDTCYSQENVLECTAEVSGNVVTFSTEDMLKVPGVAANQYYRYTLLAEYPKALKSYAISRAFSMSSNQTQSAPGDLSHIADADLMYAWSSVNWAADPICAEFKFQHILSVLQLDLKADAEGVLLNKLEVEMLDETGSDYLVITDGQINLRDGSISQKSGSNKLTLSFPVPVELPTDEYAQFYMTISPGHAGQTFKVTGFTDIGETLEIGSMKVPSEGAIPQGEKALKAFTVKAPVKEELDYGSAIDLSANGTANTYLVTQAHTLYKFRADVKGNGFVPSVLTDAGIGTTTEISPKSALVLWYNSVQTSNSWADKNPVAASTVVLKDGYIYFKTPDVFVSGNAVIAAFAEEGLTYANITVDENRLLSNATILWSWNIWAAEGYDIEADAFTAGDFTIMGRNIGAAVGKTEIESCTTASERNYVAASAIGNYYQWGNKNPYPSISDYAGQSPKMVVTPTYTSILALKESYNGSASMLDQMFGQAAGYILDFGTYLTDGDRTPANMVAYTESVPYKYMKNTKSTYGYSWAGNIGSSALASLWGDATLDNPSDHVKTIYDPCPAGWKVWSQDAWNAMIATGAETARPEYNALDESDSNKGYGFMICDSYFPTAGTARNTNFDVQGTLYMNGTKNVSTWYTVSNPSIYSSGFWAKRYQINNVFTTTTETDPETEESVTTTTNSVTMTIEGNFICSGYATPLRCVKE